MKLVELGVGCCVAHEFKDLKLKVAGHTWYPFLDATLRLPAFNAATVQPQGDKGVITMRSSEPPPMPKLVPKRSISDWTVTVGARSVAVIIVAAISFVATKALLDRTQSEIIQARY